MPRQISLLLTLASVDDIPHARDRDRRLRDIRREYALARTARRRGEDARHLRALQRREHRHDDDLRVPDGQLAREQLD
jgi:hypothetical protein